MQFVCTTFFYISIFYNLKNALYTKHTIKTPIFHPHAHTRTRTNVLPSALHEPYLHTTPISTPCNIILKVDFYTLHTKLPHPKDITYSKKLGL